MILFRKKIIFSLIVLSMIYHENSFAKGKFDISVGYFSFNAKTQLAQVSKKNIGTYDLDYRYPVNDYLEMGFGYSLLMTNTFGGDMSFGPNIELLTYPLTTPGKVSYYSEKASLEIFEKIRPYAGVSFHQRQFESIQSSYAGFGFIAGTEYWLTSKYGIKAQFRMISLSGPQSSSASQTDVSLGYTSEY